MCLAVPGKIASISGDDPLTLRDRAMLELFYSSGLRLAELVSLDIGDVDRADRTVRVVGKGSKERLVPLGEEAVGWVQRYLGEVRAGLAAFFQHDHRNIFALFGCQLFQADGGGQAARATADDDHVVFHGFARAELGEDFLVGHGRVSVLIA